MKLSTINSRLITAATAVFAAFVAFAADVSDVIVRQQWPWSTDIKVEFKLTNVTTPVTVNVEASDGDTPLDTTNLKNAITGDLWGISQSGVYTFKIDPKIAFGEERNAVGDFKVRLSLMDAPANADDILYKIVDLDSPYTVTDIRRRDFYNGKYGNFTTNFADIATGWTTSLDDVLIWTGVTEDDTYKTDKMVFRRIPAAGKSFQFQKGITAATNAYYTAGQGIKVSFSKDYYIGVFEVTQSQFMKLTSMAKYSYFNFTNGLYSAERPADRIVYTYDYNMTYLSARGQNNSGAAYRLKALTGLNVDIPTEAMWEYACRAGTDTYKYSGETGTLANSNDPFALKAERASGCNGNSGYGRNSDLSAGTMTVGSYKPNAWGLYDMLGNAREWCRDRSIGVANFWKCACYAGEDNVDPTGPTSTEADTNNRIVRGGGANQFPVANGSMSRESQDRWYYDVDIGCRLSIQIDE